MKKVTRAMRKQSIEPLIIGLSQILIDVLSVTCSLALDLLFIFLLQMMNKYNITFTSNLKLS